MIKAFIQLIDLTKKRWQWLVLGMMAMIWGTSFILMKKGLESFTHTQVAAFRIFISFILLSPFLIRRFSRVKKKHIKSLLIVAFIGNGIPAFLFTKAQTEVSSSIAGVLNTLTPLFALLLGFMFFKVKFCLHNLIGVFMGLAGTIFLVSLSGGFNFEIKNLYPLFIVLATVMYAINVNEVKKNLADLDGLTNVAVAFLFIGPLAGIYIARSNFTQAIQSEGLIGNFICIFLLALFSSVIATIMFNNLIKHTTALFASSSTYLIPVVAISWGLIDGEAFSFLQLLSVGIIMIGVYLVNRKQSLV